MVTLTKLGEEVMKSRTDYELHWPQRAAIGASDKLSQRKAKARASSLDELVPVDAAVYERLKKVRLDLAREHGSIPAYMIFPDETLRAFARLKPKSVEAGRKIRGVGEIKAQRYLPAFIEAIAGADS
jgi:ATP-dependent DNA helicase RecQ